MEYAKWLSGQTIGKDYRLPTEAEWEYAARAGSTGRYWWCKEDEPNCGVGKGRANCNGCGSQWDNKQTALVGSFKPNDFGVYDTAGNVWEWVQDCWHDSYEGSSDGGSAWEAAGGRDCALRVIREREVAAKVFGELAERYKTRPGGYTRVLKTRNRVGDAAALSIVELVGPLEEAKAEAEEPKKKASTKKPCTKEKPATKKKLAAKKPTKKDDKRPAKKPDRKARKKK